jgi:hypothetical protein
VDLQIADDLESVRAVLERAAGCGNVKAIWMLGDVHKRRRDDVSGVGWRRKAAELSHGDGMGAVGWALERGYGVKQNAVAAFK